MLSEECLPCTMGIGGIAQKPYNRGMLLAETHPCESAPYLSYSCTKHVAACCFAKCHTLPGWISFEVQEIFGSRCGSLSAHLTDGHSRFPWNPFAFPWCHGNPGSGGLHLSVLQTTLEHLLHPQPRVNPGISLDFCCWSTASRFPLWPPSSMHRFPSPCWPCVMCPADFWALPSPACPTPECEWVCVLQVTRKTGYGCVTLSLAVCVWTKSHFCAVPLAVLPPNYPFSVGFWNINLDIVGWHGVVPLYLWGFV